MTRTLRWTSEEGRRVSEVRSPGRSSARTILGTRSAKSLLDLLIVHAPLGVDDDDRYPAANEHEIRRSRPLMTDLRVAVSRARALRANLEAFRDGVNFSTGLTEPDLPVPD